MSDDDGPADSLSADIEQKDHLVDDVHRVRSRVCNAMLMALSVAVIPALASSLYRAVDIGWQPVMTYHVVLVVLTLSVTALRHKIAYQYRAGFLLGFFAFIGLSGITQFAMMSGGVLFLFLTGPIAVLFFDSILGIAIFCLSQLFIVLFGYLFVSGTLTLSFDANAYNLVLSSWITLFFGTIASGGVLVVGIYAINGYLVKAVKSARFHAENLEIHQAELEQIITQRTRDLKQSNEDLERFAQIAAHDLRSPLHVVNAHVELLEMTHDGNLDATARKHLNEISTGVTRLNQMLNDLLKYSKASGYIEEFQKTDMNQVLDVAKKHLSAEIEANLVTIHADTLPTAAVDEHLMVRVFQNLLGNCIRYQDESRPLVIKVSAQHLDSRWVFSVSDNGVGISEDQYDAIFEIYRKADNNIHPDSTGIGLAACHKIINRHKGKIWVESELGKGSTFFFTLNDATSPTTLVEG